MATILEYFGPGKNNLSLPLARQILDVPFLNNALDTLPSKIRRMVENKLVGIEIEIEKAYPGFSSIFWSVERDGSLRNDGLEYKTIYPTKIGDLWTSLQDWKKWVDKVRNEIPETYDASERCSVHVHIDARLMDIKDISKVLAIYAFLEDALFNFCGPNRKHNIFCVPLNSCQLQEGDVAQSINAWNKYGAINLKTLREFGTIEFRGMAGTDNIEYIMEWSVICALITVVAELIKQDSLWNLLTEVKTSSDYTRTIKSLMYGFTDKLFWDDVVVDQAVTNARMMLSKGMK